MNVRNDVCAAVIRLENDAFWVIHPAATDVLQQARLRLVYPQTEADLEVDVGADEYAE